MLASRVAASFIVSLARSTLFFGRVQYFNGHDDPMLTNPIWLRITQAEKWPPIGEGQTDLCPRLHGRVQRCAHGV